MFTSSKPKNNLGNALGKTPLETELVDKYLSKTLTLIKLLIQNVVVIIKYTTKLSINHNHSYICQIHF